MGSSRCQRVACPLASCQRRGPQQRSWGLRLRTLFSLGSQRQSVCWLLAMTWLPAGPSGRPQRSSGGSWPPFPDVGRRQVVVFSTTFIMSDNASVNASAAWSLKQHFICICQLCVLDFPRRLTIEMDQQELLSQEYHRVAAQMSMYRQICVLFLDQGLCLIKQ